MSQFLSIALTAVIGIGLDRNGYKFRIDLAEAKKAAKEKWSPKRDPASE